MPSATQTTSSLLSSMPASTPCKPAFCFLLVICLCMCSGAMANEFRAAVVKIDITPDNPQMLLGYQARQSTGIHDRIYHKIVALDDGKTQFYIISSDLCVIS